MKALPYLGKGIVADMELLSPSSQLLASLMDTGYRPPNTPSFKSFEESMGDPRKKIGMYMFRTGGTARFLLRGLTKVDDGEGVRWEFPTGACEPSETEVEATSTLYSGTWILQNDVN